MTIEKELSDRLEEARRTRKLNLSYTGLTEFPIECIDKIRHVRINELELSSNQLTSLPEELLKLPFIKILRLKYNKFTQLPRVLLEWKYLAVLELSGNQMVEIDDLVRDLTALKELDLSGNMITHIPETLCEMPRLEVLHLEHNRIEALPKSFGLLRNLMRINLSTNGLRSLPKSMATMKQLQRINCANNLLTSIPSEFGFLRTLKEFNLRSNNLDETYKAKTDEGLSRFLSFLREEHERERLEEIERLRPVGTQVLPIFDSSLKYRCKSDEKQIIQTADDVTCLDHACWIRTGHTICQIGNVIYLFGGCLAKDGLVTNDVFWISTDRMEWKLQQTKGDKPCARQNHVCVYSPELNSMIIFGGKSESNRHLNDSYSLNLESMTWTKIAPTGSVPSPREQASGVYWAEQFILFGGYGGGTRLNDMWILDLASMTWTQPLMNGTAPSPRHFSALCIVNSTQLLVHGGRNHFVLEDLFVCDLLSHNWSLLSVSGRTPPPRYGHLIANRGNYVYLSGGFDELGASRESMYRMEFASDVPLAQQTIHWQEWESQLEPNSSRTCILNDKGVSVLQAGSRTLGLPSSDALERGTIQWNVFKTAPLESLEEKLLDEASLTPQNPKLIRIQHILSIFSKMPKSYTIQLPKESKLIVHAKRFQEEYFRLYRHRRPLFLTPENECGVEKFICSTLRPTKTHFTELYNLEGICSFVADFVHYEPLENAIQPPRYLASPTSTLKWQAGDAFDISVLIASLLIGVGYDAYVGIGYAPTSIVFNDQGEVPYGYEDWEALVDSMKATREDDKDEDTSVDKSEKYQPRSFCPLPEIKQQIDSERSSTPSGASQNDDIENDEDTASNWSAKKVEEKNEEEDIAAGKYVHAWLILLPSREVSNIIMVEPSTGVVYTLDNCPYEGIEAVFNNVNFWVCMQLPEPHSDSRAHPQTINYDLGDISEWEPVLPFLNKRERVESHHPVSGNENMEDPKVITKLRGCVHRALEVSSWVMRLHIPQDVFDMRCPRGHKMTSYKNCQREKFALFGECARWDGMTDRVTYLQSKQPMMLDQRYERRKDKLIRRCCKLDGEATTDTIEIYGPGNSAGLKKVKRRAGVRCYVEFFPETRDDGLVSREEFVGEKIIDIFTDREDHLIQRVVTYCALAEQKSGSEDDESNNTDTRQVCENSLVIKKVTERFERDWNQDCDMDVAKRVFYLQADRIRIDFHFGCGRITRSSRVFDKDGQCQVIQVDPLAPKLTPADLLKEYNTLLTAEKNCLQSVRDLDKELKDGLEEAKQQDLNVKLTTPYYDAFRDHLGIGYKEEKENGLSEESDPLSTFMPRTSSDEVLTKEEALKVREKCLRALKERLIERANIMQTRYDEETNTLNRLMANYHRDKDQMTLEQVHDHDQQVAQITFRINILKKRLKRHENQALKRYFDLDQKLKKDSRLKALLHPT